MCPVLAEKKEGGNQKKADQPQIESGVLVPLRIMLVSHCAPPVLCTQPIQLAESLVRFSIAEFTMTESELSAIAAPAMIGLRYPSAATGTPMEL